MHYELFCTFAAKKLKLKRILSIILLFCALSIAAQPKYEVRAVWLTTLGGLDWPKSYAHDGMGILISNSTASPMTIANNTFGDNLTKRAISLAGTMERVKILSNTSKKGSNMQLYNNSASFGRDVKIIDNKLIKRGLSHDIDTTRRQINTH